LPKRNVTLTGPKGKSIVHKGKPLEGGVRLISVVKAQRLLNRGYEGFLCNVLETEAPEPSLKDTPVVQDFPDVFLEEISGMPPPRGVKFYIDRVSRATPISKVRYRIAPAEVKELKT